MILQLFLKKGIRIFNYLVMLIPICLAVFLALVYLMGGWGNIIDGHDFDYYFLKKIEPSVVLMLLIISWILATSVTSVGLSRLSSKLRETKAEPLIMGGFIFAISFGIRFLILYMYREDLSPFSDFAAAWERARGNLEGGNMAYYSLFPAYLNFSVFENLVIRMMGEKFINVLYVNALCSGLTASLLYLICTEIIGKETICILAGVIYALYPSNIIYIATGTPEFLAVFFNTLGVYILIKAFKETEIHRKLFLAFGGGVLLGVGGSYKTFSIVVFVAIAMVLVADCFTKSQEKSIRPFLITVGVICIIFFGYKVSSGVILHHTEKYFDMDLSMNKSVPHFLLIGLNTESEGQIHVGTLSRLYNQTYLSNGMDFEAAKEYAYDLLRNDWKNNTKAIIPNFAKKMIWAWQDDFTPIRYFLGSVGINLDSNLEIFVYNTILNYGAGVNQVIYLLVQLFAFFGILGYARKSEIYFIFEFLTLLVFGYFCMIFLSEGQSRYKCLVMAYIVILAALGIGNISEQIHTGKESA